MKTKIVLALFCVFMLAGCGSGLGYPDLYKSEKLPEYEDAKLVQVINNGPTLKEGVLLRLESQKDVKTISAYYDSKIKELGWTMPAVNEPTEDSYATQYDKGNKYLQITVSKITGSSQTITLNLMEK